MFDAKTRKMNFLKSVHENFEFQSKFKFFKQEMNKVYCKSGKFLWCFEVDDFNMILIFSKLVKVDRVMLNQVICRSFLGHFKVIEGTFGS